MTIVNFGLRHPGAAGRVQATGRVAWIPTERKVDGSLVVLPSRVSVTLTPEASAEIEPGVYLFHEEAVGGISAYRIVPNAIEVDYASLVAVDPATLDPEAQPEAAWYAFVESLNASNADMLASALSAQHSAELAQLSATGSQTSAAASAQLSAGSALDSQASANASANSATQAGTARDGAVSAQASAAGYASAASGYAGEAQDSADEAAVQAGLALTRAGTATDKAAEATAAVLGFGIGTVSTVGPSEAAAATVTGPVGNRVLNLTLPRGATPVFSVLETTTGPETPGATGLQGEKGDKGDPGGFTTATDLGTTDLNTILTAGLYRVTQGANVNTALNYPVTLNATAVMQVMMVSATNVIQQFEFILSTPAGRGFWQRTTSNGGTTWGPWRFFASQLVDNTAGRAIYTWDDTAVPGRSQLVWGDTGSRNISDYLNLTNWAAGTIKIRRVGSQVELRAYGLDNVAGVVGSLGILNAQLPAGFRNQHTVAGFAQIGASPGQVVVAFSATNATVVGVTDGVICGFTATWQTSDNWPTSLPGTADGTINNL
ncbi:minor tail protein [Arthrobacter phage Greenhouse]|uniref:Minor tail protein n=1 Tax=Arthrobacter phage Greenhouse TaxID=1897428 RepID=A0A1I9SE27_9CAUD|nr:minor tail protein [Arthrobacter phage Greenhouse]AOZ65104.1 hypothetical protein SEA_GREENHOUSE_1 [Arthrobacter phage Greenhouse]